MKSIDSRVYCSADSKWAYFSASDAGPKTIWRISRAGRAAPEVVVNKYSSQCQPSPDGKWLAYLTDDAGNPEHVVVQVMDLATRQPVQSVELPRTAQRAYWTADSRAFYVIDTRGGVGNLWEWPLFRVGSPHPLTHFTSDLVQEFAVSADGTRFAYVRAERSVDPVLFANFR
jgi:Tol biopolymer transport system component